MKRLDPLDLYQPEGAPSLEREILKAARLAFERGAYEEHLYEKVLSGGRMFNVGLSYTLFDPLTVVSDGVESLYQYDTASEQSEPWRRFSLHDRRRLEATVQRSGKTWKGVPAEQINKE